MGQEERAAMYLQLESTVKELKELKWKLSQTAKITTELDLYLKAGQLEDALTILTRKESLPALNQAPEFLRSIIKLEIQKADLEQKLGSKITFE